MQNTVAMREQEHVEKKKQHVETAAMAEIEHDPDAKDC